MKYVSHEYKLMRLRECPLPESLWLADTPEKIAEYARANIATSPQYNAEVENFCVVFLNTRKRIIGHSIVAIGTLDSVIVHPREVFRNAIVKGSAAIVVLHNHPSGDHSPSEADIKVTRDLRRAGELLKIELLDHVILGAGNTKSSLREMGYFYN